MEAAGDVRCSTYLDLVYRMEQRSQQDKGVPKSMSGMSSSSGPSFHFAKPYTNVSNPGHTSRDRLIPTSPMSQLTETRGNTVVADVMFLICRIVVLVV